MEENKIEPFWTWFWGDKFNIGLLIMCIAMIVITLFQYTENSDLWYMAIPVGVYGLNLGLSYNSYLKIPK